MKKNNQKKNYNPSLTTFIPDIIPYDKKAYESVGAYIQENLRKHMDKDRVKKAVFVLDDPMGEYGDDIEIIKKVLSNFLPTIKRTLHIDEDHPLKDRINTLSQDKELFGRLIKQQLNLYRQKRNSGGMLTKVLQEGPKKNHIDMTQPRKKELVSTTVPQTQKTLIANILTFMILEEESTHAKRNPKAKVHHLES